MTDRIHSLTVALDANYRDDDIQEMCDAIALFRGVVSVDRNVADPLSYVAMERAKADLREKLFKMIDEETPK